jgi:hypothetical protein
MEPRQYNSHTFGRSAMLTHNKWYTWAAEILELHIYLIYIYDNQQWRHLTILRAGSYVGKFKMYGVFLAGWSHCRRCCLSTVSAVSPKMDDNIFTVDPQIQRQGMSLVSSKSLVATNRGINWYGVGWRSLKVFSFICNLWYQLQVFRSSLFLVVHLGTFDPCSMLCRRDLLSREL